MSKSILETIVEQRKLDVIQAKLQVPVEDLMTALDVYPVINFQDRLASNGGKVTVLAEVKRASPSKGDIALDINAAKQAMIYAQSGASAISCLTEPKWFKGTIEDMKSIRVAISNLENRPALLRKDFIVDEYQIYEARANGADSLLLIVATLTDEELIEFLSKSRALNMEPLVEVATDEEMTRAIKVGAKVIGINNRNLHTFTVDLDTTKRLIANSEGASDILFVALSGISTRSDVEQFEAINVKAVLVGESLMRSSNPMNKIRELQGVPIVLVKICGIQDEEMAIATAEAGADFIGLVFAESRRKVTLERAKSIAQTLHNWRRNSSNPMEAILDAEQKKTSHEWFTEKSQDLSRAVEKTRPLIVGVFANNDVAWIQEIVDSVGLDIVQLSGTEALNSGLQFSVPVWKALHVPESEEKPEENFAESRAEAFTEKFAEARGFNSALLLDTKDATALGGTGRVFDWAIATALTNKGHQFFLAGGLNPENVLGAVRAVSPFGVDVSSGVESAPGVKDLEKIQKFILNAKAIAN